MPGKSLVLTCSLLALLAGQAFGQGIRTRIGTTGDGPGVRSGVIAEDPNIEIDAIRRDCLWYLKKAEGCFDEKKYGSAVEALGSANGLLIDRGLAERARVLANKLQQVGADQLASADEVFKAKDFAKAMDAYRRVAGTFAWLPVSKEAREKLATAEKDPDVLAASNEVRAAAYMRNIETMLAQARKNPPSVPASRLVTAERAVAGPAASAPSIQATGDVQAILALKPDDLLNVVETLEKLVKTCQGSSAAAKAQQWLDQLQAQPDWKANLAKLNSDREARKLLAQAQMYRDAGLKPKAIQHYRLIVEKFPNSPPAEAASRELMALEAGGK